VGAILFVSRRRKALPVGMSAAAEPKKSCGAFDCVHRNSFPAGAPWRAEAAAEHAIRPSRWTFANLMNAHRRRVYAQTCLSDTRTVGPFGSDADKTHSHACLCVETHRVILRLIRVYLSEAATRDAFCVTFGLTLAFETSNRGRSRANRDIRHEHDLRLRPRINY
jgi:hypothetical protein